jgi:hypothetical protein
MIFQKGSKKQRGTTGRAGRATGRRLHSIGAVLKQRDFAGSFSVAESSYKFVFIPSRAELSGAQLQLLGRLEITGPRGATRTRDNVIARLVSAQGGIGVAPIRRQVLVGGVSESTASSSGQQQQVAGDKPGAETRRPEADTAKAETLPEVESTGALSFCGAMYFQLEPLTGSALGVNADLGRVQLNVRLAPVDDKARALQGAYSSAVDALYSKEADARMASEVIGELNKLLAAG